MASRESKQEVIDNLREAQEAMFQALEILQWYEKVTGDKNAGAYVIDPLAQLTSQESGFITTSPNIDVLIQRVKDDKFNLQD